MGKQSELEKLAEEAAVMSGLPSFVKEYHYQPGEKWRADIAFPQFKILVEIHGGIWVQGRHVRGSGFKADRIKYRTAQINGWMVLEFCPGEIKSKEWLWEVWLALGTRGWVGPLLSTQSRAAHGLLRRYRAARQPPEQFPLFGGQPG